MHMFAYDVKSDAFALIKNALLVYICITDIILRRFISFCTRYLINSAKIAYCLLINWYLDLADTCIEQALLCYVLYIYLNSLSQSQRSKLDCLGNLYFDIMVSDNSSGIVRSRNTRARLMPLDHCLVSFLTSTCCWIRCNNAVILIKRDSNVTCDG